MFLKIPTLPLLALLVILQHVPLLVVAIGMDCPADHTPCSVQDGAPGNCKPLVNCAYYWGTKARFENCSAPKPPECTMGSGYKVVCCPEVKLTDGHTPDLLHEPPLPNNTVTPSAEVVIACIQEATANLSEFRNDNMFERTARDPSNFKTGISTQIYNADFKFWSECAWLATQVACCLQKNVPGYNPLASEKTLVRLVEFRDYLPPECQAVCSATDSSTVRCRPQVTLDRSLDGKCNSFALGNGLFGTYRQRRARFIPPEYSDHCYEPKKPCPYNPRRIRTCAMPEQKVADCGVNQLMTDFGQFMSHDVAHGPTWQGSHSGAYLDCCFGVNGRPEGVTPNPKCTFLNVTGDSFYDRCQGVDCLNVGRVALTPNEGCGAGAAHQMNGVSHYLDLSQVYGSNTAEGKKVRNFEKGRLNTSGGHCCDQQLPESPDQEGCAVSACGRCRLCGDMRSNEQPGLNLLHTLFVRFHNYCTFKIREVNPLWTDEKLYRMCKKILISIYHIIVYNEYIPLLLGYETASKFGVMGATCNYTYDWATDLSPQTREEWASAVGRLHSTVSGKITLKNACYQTVKRDRLVNHYNNPTILQGKGRVDQLLRGKLSTCQAGLDKYFDCQLSSCLMKERANYGLDVSAMNIARDCDVALLPYYKTWPLCRREKTLEDWDDLIGVFHPDDIECLKGNYESVKTIPLYIALLMELKTDCDSMVGPTLACITGQQLKLWRVADFHFFSNNNVWKPSELAEIRKASFAYLLCETSCIKCVNIFPFRVPGPRNPLVCCGDHEKIPKINWEVFKEGSQI